MGTAELWTGDNTLYRFTESTSLDPTRGEIMMEPAELRRRMIHVRRSQSNAAASADANVDYAALRPRKIDTSRPDDYTAHLRYACLIAALCNNSSVNFDPETKQWQTVGDPTEVALTVAAQKANAGRSHWQAYEKFFERAFDSERKLMSTAVAHGDDETLLLCKGAPEELLRKCTSYMLPDSNHEDMTDDFASAVTDESSRMASQGLRVLGLALKTLGSREESALTESDLTFVGLVGLLDPPKDGVKESVETCQKAGIRVMMITGDHVDTATAIASKLGIFKAEVPGMVWKHYRTYVHILIFTSC